MKQIIMIRHAKSSWSSGFSADKDRPLNDRGRRDAPLMAQKLLEICSTIDWLAVSTAKRTRETAAAFLEAYGNGITSVEYYDELYHGLPTDYESVLYGIEDHISTVAMIGHNPGMTNMANNCINCTGLDNVPTCGFFILQSNATSWTDVDLSACTRSHFLYPKMYV